MSKPVYLYFLRQPRLSRVKIGISNDPEKRRSYIESAAHISTELLWSKRYPSRSKARAAEKACLRQFSRHKTRGEYFSDDVKLNHVQKYVATLDRKPRRSYWPLWVTAIAAAVFC